MKLTLSGIKFIRNKVLSNNFTYISDCGNFFLKEYNNKYLAQKEHEILTKFKDFQNFIHPIEYLVKNSNHYIVYPYAHDSFELGSSEYYEKNLNDNKLFYEICKSVKFLHDQNIAHLDIKPANILIHNGVPKIIDFEFSEDLTNIKKIKRRKGTRSCVSPEMINYFLISQHCDMWSMGVVYYTMKNFDYPFKEERIIKAYKLKEMIPPRYMNSIEQELLYLMLDDDYKRRSNINDVISFMEHNIDL